MKTVSCFYCNTRISEAHKFCKECGRENIYYKEPVKKVDLKSLEQISLIVKDTKEKFLKKYGIDFYTYNISIKNKPLLVTSTLHTTDDFALSLMFFIDLANQLKDVEGINIIKDINPDNTTLQISIILEIKDECYRIYNEYIGLSEGYYRICSRLGNNFNKRFKYIYNQLLSMEGLFKMYGYSPVSEKPVAEALVEIVNKQYQTTESAYKVLSKAKRTIDRVLKEVK